MFKMLYPYEYAESVFDIDYHKLYTLGYRGIIFDIDNTLVHHGEDSTPEVDELFKQIHTVGLKTLLLSNNSTERIERFLKNIESLYIPYADKPRVDNYYKAVRMLGLERNEVVFVGDQLFTDIYGANKSGIANILVKFLQYEHETKIGKKRTLEKFILEFYKRNKAYRHRIGDIHKEGSKREYVVEKR